MSDAYGHVYVLTNPAWPGWVKVGCVFGTSLHVEGVLSRRISNYNVADPHNAFAFEVSRAASCAKTAETYVHELLSVHHDRGKGEWFKCPLDKAKEIVELACGIARLRPERRKPRFEQALEEEMARKPHKDDDTVKILREIAEVPNKRPEIGETARAAHLVIRELLESMAMPDERLEAAAEAVLRRLDALGGER